jgi:hypothetical protein
MIIQPILSVGDHVESADAGAAYGLDGPAVHSDMVWMPRLTVRGEGQDGIRGNLANDLCDLVGCCIEVHIRAAAIWIAQPAMLGDAEDTQARSQLRLTNGRELLGRPPGRIGYTKLAATGRNANDPSTRGGGHRHDAAAQIGLIIWMGPDRQDRPELSDVSHHHE